MAKLWNQMDLKKVIRIFKAKQPLLTFKNTDTFLKNYLKYKYGFVNIDSENLYFANSGNWTETKNLNEKGNHKNRTLKKIGITIFLTVCAMVLAFLIVNHLYVGRMSLVMLVLFPLGLFLAYKYLRTELGAQFRLPLTKILKIETNENTVRFTFDNSEGVKDTYKIQEVDQKGLALIHEVKESIGV